MTKTPVVAVDGETPPGNMLRPYTARKRGGGPTNPELDYRTVIGCGFKIA
jgi:hypothetical protein